MPIHEKYKFIKNVPAKMVCGMKLKYRKYLSPIRQVINAMVYS